MSKSIVLHKSSYDYNTNATTEIPVRLFVNKIVYIQPYDDITKTLIYTNDNQSFVVNESFDLVSQLLNIAEGVNNDQGRTSAFEFAI